MVTRLQLAKAYSVAELRSIPHNLRPVLEVILLPGRDRYLWNASSTADDDGDLVLAPTEAAPCRCCGTSGRWLKWAVAASGGGGGGVTDHGALTGLADNDHPQYTTDAEALTIAEAAALAAVVAHEAAPDTHEEYILADGTRAFSGDQSMGGNQITNVGAPGAGTDAARLVDIEDEMDDHEGASDPHPVYTTEAEVIALIASGALKRSRLIQLTD